MLYLFRWEKKFNFIFIKWAKIDRSIKLLDNALAFIKDVISKEGKILFIGTKMQANNIVKKHALECNQFYVNKRWLGGMLTNWSTVSNSLLPLGSLAWV